MKGHHAPRTRCGGARAFSATACHERRGRAAPIDIIRRICIRRRTYESSIAAGVLDAFPDPHEKLNRFAPIDIIRRICIRRRTYESSIAAGSSMSSLIRTRN
jgi:hypothetical protein